MEKNKDSEMDAGIAQKLIAISQLCTVANTG